MKQKAWGGGAMLVALAIGLAASLAGRSASRGESRRGPPEHGPSPVEASAQEEALEGALFCPPVEALLDSGPSPDSSPCSAPLTLNSEVDFRG